MSKANMIGRLSLTARIGFALILLPIACLSVQAYWASTRIWEPLDVPISLSKGHFRTAKFSINVESGYSIAIEVDPGSGFEHVSCPDRSDLCEISASLLRASWTLSNDEKIVATGGSEPKPGAIWRTEAVRVLGRFEASRGHYILDVGLLEDERSLNSHKPRLVIFEDEGKYSKSSAKTYYALLGFLLLAPVGVCTIICSEIVRRQKNIEVIAKACSLTQPIDQAGLVGAPVHWRIKPSKGLLFAGMPPFGLFAANIFLLLVIILSVLQSLDRHVPVGLRVRLLRPGTSTQRSPGIQPLLVRMQFAGRNLPPNLYIDSQGVRWENFDAALQQEINKRPPNWPVYLEGDPDTDWGWAANAIDRIRGLQADVVLLTHRTAPGRQLGSRTAVNPVATGGRGQR